MYSMNRGSSNDSRGSSNDSSAADDETDDEEASISSSISTHSASEEEELPPCPAARLLYCNNVQPSDQQERYSNSQQVHLSNSQQMANSRREKRSSKNALFMEEKLIEEREAEEREEMESRRVTSAMKVREDTLDGAEEPDTDPPQRRKTIEDISIEELSALRSNLPPEYPEDDAPPTLLPCLTCNRTFNPKALDRHRKVCQKLSETNKKKQVFNAITQKFEGLDSSSGQSSARATTPERKNSANKKPSRWREKHKEFLRTIRAARGTPEGDADAGPNIPSDYIQCPHCERHFGPKAAERHIDWCKEQSTRLRRGSADTQLVERLRSRTKYVPPKPGQSGWRAPKKTDVISSIPPPSSGPTPDMRKISPPHLGLPHHPRRGVSPAGQRNAPSLGRQTARSFTSLLQAVSNNYQSPYGQRMSTSGYATPSSYSAYGGQMGGSRTPNLSRSGSFSGSSPGGSFSRSASLRIPNSRRNSSKMARRRDLASDMLASVMQGMSPARGEPEGNEAEDFSSRETTLSPPPFKSSKKMARSKLNLKSSLRRTQDREMLELSQTEVIAEETEEDQCNEMSQGASNKSRDRLTNKRESLKDDGDTDIQLIDNEANRKDSTECGGSESPILDESEDELDIPNEEHYYKSCSSLSDENEDLEGSMSRPRSVHFEDEHWEGGQYVSKQLSRSDGTLYLESCSSAETRDSRSNSGDSRYGIHSRKPANVRSARRESVREMLRKRRVEVEEAIELDGRRRLKSIEDVSTSKDIKGGRPRSRSKETGFIKTQSLHNVNNYNPNKYKSQRPPKSSSKVKKGEAFITSSDLARIHSLVKTPARSSSSSSSSGSSKKRYDKTKREKKEYYERSYNDLKYDSSYDSKFGSPSLYSPSKFELPKFDACSKFDDLFDTKFEDPVVEVSYDPYSAAEMQMQALLGSPMKKGSANNERLGAAGLGTGQDTSPPLGGGKFIRRTTPPSPKPRPTKFDTSLSPALSRRAQSPYYSDSLSASPSREKSSPWRLSPSPPPRDRWPAAHSPNQAWSPTRGSPTRESTYGRTSPGTGYSAYRNGTPDTNKRANRYSVSSTGSRREVNTSEMYDNQYNSTSEKDTRLFKRSTLSGRLSSGSTDDNDATRPYSSTFGRTLSNESNNNRSTLESKPTLRGTKSSSSTLSSLKTLRSAIQGNTAEHKIPNSYSDAKATRCSSSSSESSLPPLSSPSISPSYNKLRPKKDFTSPEIISTPRLHIKKSSVNDSNEDSLDQIISSLTNMGMESESASTAKFCHDCGQKYPSEVAKFCCHCGSRRSS